MIFPPYPPAATRIVARAPPGPVIDEDTELPPNDDLSPVYFLEVSRAVREAIHVVNHQCLACASLLRVIIVGPCSHFMPHSSFA